MVVLDIQDRGFLLHNVAVGILAYLSPLASSSDVTVPICLTMIAIVALNVPPSNIFLFQSRIYIAKTCCMP